MRYFLGFGGVLLCVFAVAALAEDEPPAPAEPPPKSETPAKKETNGSPQKKAAAASQNAKKPAKKGDKSADKAVPEQAERERQEFLKKTGILLWPELTDEQQKSFLKKQKDYLEDVKKKVTTGGMVLYETNFFLFFSDVPPMYVKMYTPYLDTMYRDLCNAFGLDPKKNIFQGKCMVVAFAQEASFQQYENAFFQGPKPAIHAQGLAHCNGNGEVVISCFAGADPQYFATVMVHETSHGFMFRYKSNKNIPNWLNEGAAEWIAKHVVTRDQAIPHKIQASIAQMRQTGNMGGNFFTAEHIDKWQYGLAAHITEFLLQYNAKGYKQMIDDIKLGKPWQEALSAPTK